PAARQPPAPRPAAGQQVLPAQVLQRAARAAKLFVARDRAWLGREAVDRVTVLAEARRTLRLVVGVGPVQSAIHLRELVVHVADFEVAPQTVVVAVRSLDV